MRVALGCDHGGFRLKEHLKAYLDEKGIAYHDFGVVREDSVDYPDYAELVGEAVLRGDFDRGVLMCGTGIGISIAANKIPGIRAALCHDPYSARMSREHNDANVLAMGARVIGPGLALDILDAWLAAEFQGGRHALRVGKISSLEQKYLGAKEGD
ncbi:MAG: ribose 5-phosphate isomerase B [Bacillota bacterium]